jgi:hypothetical protein
LSDQSGDFMAKEVGAGGRIALGKEHAGKRFDVVSHPDGRVELIPVQSSSAERADMHRIVHAPDGWLPPGGYDHCSAWALENSVALEQYAQEIRDHGTAAEQLERYLAEHPEMLSDDHGEI